LGLGHALNIIVVYKSGPASNMPGVYQASAAIIGLAALVGLILTPLFSSKHPVAVAFQWVLLGAAIGSFVTPFVYMFGSQYIEGEASGPASQFADAFAVIGLMVLTVCGTVGGAILGLIGRPVLKWIHRK
jgi:lipoprotein signal peptidase